MFKRLTTTAGALGALAALALGGSALASAQSTHVTHRQRVHQVVEKTAGPDRDNVRSGGQTAQDRTAKTPNSESSGESSGEASGVETDGPGGHQDPPGASVDHQFQGQE